MKNCKNCGKKIEQSNVGWRHVNQRDQDDSGVACLGNLLPDAEYDYAEPTS